MEFEGIKILVIDDQPDNLFSIKVLIKEAFKNSFVLTSLSGAKGIELALIEQPDVILLDVIMPEMDGFEVCRIIKANSQLEGIPVVFVTALKGDRESRIKALEAGGDAFLIKPVDESELIAQIRAMVKIRRANQYKEDINHQLKKLVDEKTRELRQTHKATLNLLEDLKSEIIARQKTEIALRESEEKYRLLVENSPNGIAIFQDGIIVYVNQTVLRKINAQTRDEVLGKPLATIVSTSKSTSLSEKFESALHKRQILHFEEKLLKLTGEAYEVEIVALETTFNGKPAGQVIITDISERKQAEKALRESELKFREMANLLPQVIFEIDMSGKVTYVNQMVEVIFRYQPEELIGFDSSKVHVPEEISRVTKNINLKIRGAEIENNEYQMLRKDGTVFPALIYTNLIEREGVPVGLRGVVIDITAQRENEKSLRESEGLYRAILNASPDSIIITNNSGIIEMVSPSTLQNFGIKSDLLIKGKVITDFVNESDREKAISKFKLFQQGIVTGPNVYKIAKSNGEVVSIEVEEGEIPDLNGKAEKYIYICRNITERIESEKKIVNISRMYAFLSQVNQSIINSKNQEELFQSVCNVAIVYGQFRMAWIGLHNPDIQKIIHEFSAGHINGYLEEIDIDLNDPSKSQGPTGSAYKSCNIVVCNDIENDPRMLMWKDAAIKRKYLSSCAVPLIVNNVVIGVFTLYTSEKNFFREDEQNLIKEIAQNLSFAINAIQSENERKIAEESLIESESRYNSFINNNEDCIFVKDENFRYLIVNDAMARFFDREKSEIINKTDIELDDHHQIYPCVSSDKKALNAENAIIVEEQLGNKIYETIKFPMKLKDNRIGIGGIMRNITERKKSEKALLDSRKELQTIYDNAPVMLSVIDINGQILFANQLFSMFLGLEENEFVNGAFGGVVGCINSMFDPRGCGYSFNCRNCSLRTAIEQTFSTGIGLQNIEYQSTINIKGISKEVSLLGSTALIETNGQQNILLSLHDITKRKSIEEALHKSETLLRTFIDNTPFEIWARDRESVGILENKKFVDHYGSIIGITPQSDSRVDNPMKQKWKKLNDRVLGGESVEEELEFPVNGEMRIFQQILFPIRSFEKIIGLAGFNIDVTDKKLAEQQLHDYNQRLEMAMQIGNIAWWEMNYRTGDIHFGERKTEILGYKKTDFNHYRDFMRLVHPDDYHKCINAMRNHILGKTERYEVEYRIMNSSGSYRWFYDVGSVTYRKEKKKPTIVSGLVMDITARKIAEESLKESREQLKDFAAHLQNVREEERVMLAREIHDDLGQILVAMKIDMGMLKKYITYNLKPDLSNEIIQKFDNLILLVDNTIKTARRIMTDLRPEVLELLGFTEAVKAHIKTFGERYKIETNFVNNISQLSLNSQQSIALFRIIQEALNNVAKHAKASKVEIIFTQNIDKLTLKIKDNGIGIEKNAKRKTESFGIIGMRERIFLLGGEISIDGEKNKGTIILIEIPLKNNTN